MLPVIVSDRVKKSAVEKRNFTVEVGVIVIITGAPSVRLDVIMLK